MEIILSSNKMKDDLQKQPSSEQITLFVQYLTEILAHILVPPPEPLLQVMNQVSGINASDKSHLIANPPTFFRMSSILYRGTNPTMSELSRTLSLPLSTTTRM